VEEKCGRRRVRLGLFPRWLQDCFSAKRKTLTALPYWYKLQSPGPRKGAQGLANQAWGRRRDTTTVTRGNVSMAHAGLPAMEGLHGLGGGLVSSAQVGGGAVIGLCRSTPPPVGEKRDVNAVDGGGRPSRLMQGYRPKNTVRGRSGRLARRLLMKLNSSERSRRLVLAARTSRVGPS
jgi:hypothetical protein